MKPTQDHAVLTQGICYKMKMDLQFLAQIGLTARDTFVTSLRSKLLNLCGLLYFITKTVSEVNVLAVPGPHIPLFETLVKLSQNSA
jgi:hypothetical protein